MLQCSCGTLSWQGSPIQKHGRHGCEFECVTSQNILKRWGLHCNSPSGNFYMYLDAMGNGSGSVVAVSAFIFFSFESLSRI